LRTYIYGLEDVVKAVEALNEAERRGYHAGRREHAQLGDAYQAQADRRRRECDRLPEERVCGCLKQAGEWDRQAVEWYGRAEGYGDTSRGLSRAHTALTAVTERMWELQCRLEDFPATDGR
jgi:hypothetical protein